ncbi:MAG: site-specific DNA-methyltransferase [Acidimicrobiales bacterium]|nr:site-specific DNA-methyltransferase [Acidimicrobiales bacterium]
MATRREPVSTVKKTTLKKSSLATKKGTSTSNFGVSKRESHDSSLFYSRFSPPEISRDSQINPCKPTDVIKCQDSRDLSFIPDNSIALVVTSPPYFVGKEYELAMGTGHIPSTYLAYLEMLRDVFAQCAKKLEPGGRIAINVANLGRKPFRSLSGDITTIVQDELHLLMRGEILWVKGKGANGSCAWGSYGSAANPVLRDVSERIIIASKGRFDRAPDRAKRESLGLPYENTIDPADFRAWTLDTWYFPPESAKRVGHPAPFPVELPRRLIELYTYKGDTVLDPFLGAGSTALAAKLTRRHYVGVDMDKSYVALAKRRVKDAKT